MRRAIYTLSNCAVCGKPFPKARKTAKTCSPACRKRASRAGRKKGNNSVTDVTIKQLEFLLRKHAEKLGSP